MDKLSMAVDGLSEKRPDTRITAIVSLQKAFRVNYLLLDDTWNYYDTLLSGLESSIKRGKPSEQVPAAECLAIFAAQVSPLEINEIASRFQPFMEKPIADPGASCAARGSYALSLAWLFFLGNVDDFSSIKLLMTTFERNFKLSCLKGDGKTPVQTPAAITMNCACLNAWSLLYTTLPSQDAATIGQTILPTFISILQSTNIDIRLAVGDAISLVYERIRYEVNENFKGNNFTQLTEVLSHMVHNSNKSQSKNDLKKQRHAFRDLLSFLMTHDIPFERVIKLKGESLIIDSYCQSFYYESFCRLFTIGTSAQMQENELVRNVLGMGPPLPKAVETHKQRTQDKSTRHYANQFAFKIRTRQMGNSRDKRNYAHDSGDS